MPCACDLILTNSRCTTMCNWRPQLQISSVAVVAMSLSFATVAPAEFKRTFRISEARNGSLAVNGREITTADLDATFREITREHGYIVY